MKEVNIFRRDQKQAYKTLPDVWNQSGEIFSRLIRAQFDIMSNIASDLKFFVKWVNSILEMKEKIQINSNLVIVKSVDLNEPELQYQLPQQKMSYYSIKKLFLYFADYLGSLKITHHSSDKLFEAFLQSI